MKIMMLASILTLLASPAGFARELREPFPKDAITQPGASCPHGNCEGCDHCPDCEHCDEC